MGSVNWYIKIVIGLYAPGLIQLMTTMITIMMI